MRTSAGRSRLAHQQPMPQVSEENSDRQPRAIFSRLVKGCSALRHRDFRLLWIGTLVSNIGSWAQKVATAWLIYHLTNSAAWLGIDAFASGLPAVLLLPWGGALADRVNRRTLLIWTNAMSALLAFVLAALVASDLLRVWHIVVISALSGVVQALIIPASSSLLPTLVGEKDTANAIALNSLQFNLSRVIGPAIGGVTLFHLGAAWSFALNGLSFLALVFAIALIATLPAVIPTTVSIGANLRDGLRFVRQRSEILTSLILVMLAAFCSSPMISMMPALTKSVLHRDAKTYSFLLSTFGAGAVAAAAVVALSNSKGAQPRRALASLLLFGACQIAVGFQLPLAVTVALVAVAGLTFISAMIRLGTAIIQSSPDEYRGRTTSLQSLGFRAAQPLGSLIAGFIAHQMGVQIAFWAYGGLLIVAIALVQRFGTLRTTAVNA